MSREPFRIDEERLADFLCSFTLDAVTQLDRSTSTALAAIREWKNSFTPINRIPLDVLSLIPTHLSSQEDRFRATFVCRHWRRTFLQHGTLWSQVSFQNGEAYMKILLERAKGAALDVSIGEDVPATSMAVLSPHVQQIKYLEFNLTRWKDIRKFSEVNSGPLPLLHTLTIFPEDRKGPVAISPPSHLFSNATNLEEFTFNSFRSPSLNHFVFPRLTTFRMRILEVTRTGASELFDFLKASPTLRTVDIRIIDIVLEGIPRQTVVVLPDVETFSLTSGGMVYDVAAHISCPHAKNTTLIHKMLDLDMTPGQKVFPTSVSLNTIIHQYTRSPVEEVTLEMKQIFDPCSLTFQSPGTSTIRFLFHALDISDQEYETADEIAFEAFSQGLDVIQVHPQLSHVKRLHIGYPTSMDASQIMDVTPQLGVLFGSLGPLDRFTIGGDLIPYFGGFGGYEGLAPFADRIVFPPIKELTILHPVTLKPGEWDYMGAIVGLAKSQHTNGMPFERVTVRASMLEMVEGLAQRLRQWVGTADCCWEDSVTEAY